MPEKDKNTLFKRIIFRKYKDEIDWVKMINWMGYTLLDTNYVDKWTN